MPLCVIKHCKNNSNLPNTVPGISYHKFPRDEPMKKKWIEIIRNIRKEPEWCPSSYSIVCSKHFKKSDRYGNRNGMNRLHKHAVPILDYVHADDNKQVEVPKKASEINVGIIVGFKIDNSGTNPSIQPIVVPPKPEVELMEIKLKKQVKKFLNLKLLMTRKLKVLEERVQNLTKTNIALRAKLKS